MKAKTFRLLVTFLTVGLITLTVLLALHSPATKQPLSDDSELQLLDLPTPMCTRPPQVEPASFSGSSESLFAESPMAAAVDVDLPTAKNIAPLRSIWEPGPNFSGVFVDVAHDEIVAIDNNHMQILVYARLANGLTPPLRTIKGLAAQVDFPSAVFVNDLKDEIYVVDNEISDRVTVHSRTASGNAKPLRSINLRLPTADKRYYNGIMHYFGLWGDPERGELVGSSQVGNNIVTVEIESGVKEAGPVGQMAVPKRNIQGPNTGLADPRGLSIDKKHNEIVVVTDGHIAGAVLPPSIRFYNRDANGDVAPLRVIEGPATKLEYLAKSLYLDTVNDEIYVATSNNAILVFPRAASGNVTPVRVLEGDKTGLDHPTGVFVDTEHNEMVVSNWENFSITVYPRTADGNVAPIRTIRASGDARAVGLLRGRAITLDRVNDDIWHLN